MPRTQVTGPFRQQVDNLVYNGNFEYAPAFTAATTAGDVWINGTAGGSNTNDVYGWGTVITVNGSASFDTSVKYSGSASIKLSCINATGQVTVGPSKLLATPAFSNSKPIPVLPNTSYTLTALVKTNNVAANSAFIDMREYTGALAIVTTTSSTRLSGTNDWTLLTCTATTGATTRFIMPILRNNVAGNVSDAWFDDIKLRPTTPVTRTAITGPFRQPVDNMVRNGDFEYAPAFTAATTSQQKWIDGTAGGSSAGDSPYRWGTLAVTGTASTRYDGTVSRSGSYSLKLSTTAVASAIRVANMNSLTTSEINRLAIPVLPSTSYTLTYWMKTQANSGSATSGARMRITERDGVGGAVITDGTLVTTTTDWTQYTITKTTASTTRFIDVEMFVTGNDGTATLIMDAWFDNIKLDLTSGTTRTVVT